MNRSAYWVPSMIDTATNAPIQANANIIYYKSGAPDKVQYLPKGLRMIAGNSKATGPQTNPQIRFTCNNDYNTRSDTIPPCAEGQYVDIMFSFPSCWDGVNLDSPNHKDHMSYTCDASHPVVLPEITYNVSYKVGPGGTSKWRLASDNYPSNIPGGYSMHGDWMNGWDESFVKVFTDNCLKARRDCHAHLLGDGRTFGQ